MATIGKAAPNNLDTKIEINNVNEVVAAMIDNLLNTYALLVTSPPVKE